MKKYLVLILMLLCELASAGTIYTFQDVSTNNTYPFGLKINAAAFSAVNPRLTGVVQVDTKRTICYDINIVDANSSITSVDMTCTYGRTPATVAAYGIDVYTSTTAAGVTTSVTSTIHKTATGGGAPGTSGWGWCVTNIPGPFIQCSFLANGVITADIDTISVFARGITP